MNYAQTWVTSLVAREPQPRPLVDSIAAARGTRFLLIAADSTDEITAADYLRDHAPDRVSVWIAKGAGHAAGLATDRNGWSETVIRFLTQTLGSQR